jgi:hypothetical protein
VSFTTSEEVAAGSHERALPGVSTSARPEDMQLLERAAELVAFGWCQRALAYDRDGRQVEPWREDARSWSPLGALLTAWYEDPGAGKDAFEAAYTALALATGGRLEEWNAARWRTRQHVLSAFFRAHEYLPPARRRIRRRNGAPSPFPERPERPDPVD